MGCKLLLAAAIGDKTEIQKYLTERPDHIQFRDYDRRTALHVAASEGRLDIVKLLVEHYNSPINRSDRWGGSPLDDAHRHRHMEVVQYLRSKGATTGSSDLTTNFLAAAAAGDIDELQMILNTFWDSSQKGVSTSGKGVSASGKGVSTSGRGLTQRPIVMINRRGVIPDTQKASIGNSRGKNRASGVGSSTTASNSSVDINKGDYDGRTALHLAAAAGHVKVVRLLISKGADINATDNWGGKPLDDAIRQGRVECIKILKEMGAESGGAKHLEDSGRSSTGKEDKNLQIEFSELDVIDKIGAGAFGEIFKCRWRGTVVAAKCIRSTKIIELWREQDNMLSSSSMKTDGEEMKAEEKEEALRDFREETSILRTLRHPNICMLLGYSRTENFEVMISELMRCSLLDIFKSHIINNTKMPKRKQIIYAQQLAKGMNYLHQCKPPIIHRDLKPANLLIDGSGTLKISDFGLAKVRPDPKRKESESFRMTGETGSYRFMAPEVFRHEDYTETVDIYSFAMIFYYLLAGRPPWDQLSGLKAVIKAAMEADRPVVERSWDIQLSNMIQRCWDENPSARPSFEVIVKELHEYSKNALKLDLDNIAITDETRSCCVIS
jgi:ankyrin repeat protein